MQRRARHPFLTADDMRDFHEMVVDYVGHMVGGQVVGTLVKHLVVDDVAHDGHIAADDVGELDRFARRHLEANHILGTVVDEGVDLLLRHGDGVAHRVAGPGVVLEIGDFLALGLQLLGCVESNVCLAALQQLVDIASVDFPPLALPVRTVVAANTHTFVKLDAQPHERLENVFFGTRHKSSGVGVLDAEHKVTPVLLGEEIVVQSSANTADMQWPSGTWCETHPYFPFNHDVVLFIPTAKILFFFRNKPFWPLFPFTKHPTQVWKHLKRQKKGKKCHESVFFRIFAESIIPSCP